jgi:hypothetical protein
VAGQWPGGVESWRRGPAAEPCCARLRDVGVYWFRACDAIRPGIFPDGEHIRSARPIFLKVAAPLSHATLRRVSTCLGDQSSTWKTMFTFARESRPGALVPGGRLLIHRRPTNPRTRRALHVLSGSGFFPSARPADATTHVAAPVHDHIRPGELLRRFGYIPAPGRPADRKRGHRPAPPHAAIHFWAWPKLWLETGSRWDGSRIPGSARPTGRSPTICCPPRCSWGEP